MKTAAKAVQAVLATFAGMIVFTSPHAQQIVVSGCTYFWNSRFIPMKTFVLFAMLSYGAPMAFTQGFVRLPQNQSSSESDEKLATSSLPKDANIRIARLHSGLKRWEVESDFRIGRRHFSWAALLCTFGDRPQQTSCSGIKFSADGYA